MANEKSVFKIWTCRCGYKKHDCEPDKNRPPLCKNDQRPMTLSEKWYARVTRDGKGPVKPISTRKQAAIDFVIDCKRAARNHAPQPGLEKDITWTQAVKSCKGWWQDAVDTKDLSKVTRDSYYRLVKSLTYVFEDKTLLTITKADIKAFQARRAREGVLPSTINHEYAALNRMYAMHTTERTTEAEAPRLFSKARDIYSVGKLSPNAPKARWLSAEEITALLAACLRYPYLHAIVTVGLATGLRKSNVLGLTWQEVSLSRGEISIPGSKMKSGKAHTIELTPPLIAMLQNWHTHHVLSKWVFANEDGTAPFNIRSFRWQWESTVKRCGFNVVDGVPVPHADRVTVHTLRHTFASQFLMAGGDLATLSELLAHANISTTKTIYGHLSREHKRQAVQKFGTDFLNQFIAV
jgi:integrase